MLLFLLLQLALYGPSLIAFLISAVQSNCPCRIFSNSIDHIPGSTCFTWALTFLALSLFFPIENCLFARSRKGVGPQIRQPRHNRNSHWPMAVKRNWILFCCTVTDIESYKKRNIWLNKVYNFWFDFSSFS